MKIIPAIDIIEGKCVRLSQGDFSQATTYYDDPLEVAKQFEEFGLRYLHLVDLDGARRGKITNHKVLERIAQNTSLIIDFGGGLKTDEDVRIAFESGASQITGGSIAVKDPERFERWIEQYGTDKIILGADVSQGNIAVSGWQEASELDVFSFVNSYYSKGLTRVICTDISKDGMLLGPGFSLYQSLFDRFPKLQLIASGGVTTLDDLTQLQAMGCEGAIIGKAIYEGTLGLEELAAFNNSII
jgi:phosphoribosylformimino-5-aminoimidazole carboxamide ribotide isomerase